jgi:hypothetical protein
MNWARAEVLAAFEELRRLGREELAESVKGPGGEPNARCNATLRGAQATPLARPRWLRRLIGVRPLTCWRSASNEHPSHLPPT